MKSKKQPNLDEYFKFLKDYFAMFDFSKLKRKPIKGNNFKL